MKLIYWLFFLSGAAGLIYQVVWSRLLHEIFGVTVYAVTTVIATFLLGLALGGLALGRVADRQREPLRFYGWLEIGIGITCVLGLLVLALLDPLHVAAANRFPTDSVALIGIRVLLASIVILPPTFLMGGTLPVVTRVFVRQMQGLGRQLSLLYALNTAGAVVGSLAAGFLLIRAFGLDVTLGLAVVINVGVGLAALALARGVAGVELPEAVRSEDDASRTRDTSTPARGRLETEPRGVVDDLEATGVETDAPASRVGSDAAPTPGAVRTREVELLLAVGVAGFASLGLEVFWTRILILLVGTTTYAFVTVLSSYLVGITLGSFLTSLFADRVRNLRRAFGWIQLGIAASVLGTLWILRLLNSGALESTLEAQGWLALILGRFGVSFLLMLVPTTLIGMTFPIAGKLWSRRLGALGGDIGVVYASNTIGNILGAGLSGFVVLPWLGLQKGVAALTMLNLVSAAWGFTPSGRPRARFAALVPLGAALVVYGLFLGGWNPPQFLARGEDGGDQVLYYDEGLVATVKVIQRAEDASHRWMAVDGIKIGESSGGVDMKQQVLAHFPFLLRPDEPIERVLSIGLGTGILIGESARHPEVKRVACVEISPSVIEAAELFADENGDIFANSDVEVICDDGVNFLRRIDESYDAIISDAKSRTAHAGNALFYSRDYYELCAEHLEPGGIMIQWIPLILPPAELTTIARTFFHVFEYGYVWFAYDACFLVGRDRPLELDFAHIERVLASPAASDLREWGWVDAESIVDLLIADQESARAWYGEAGPINSLGHPVLEFYAPRDYAVPQPLRKAENIRGLREAHAEPIRHARIEGGDAGERAERRRRIGLLMEGIALVEGVDPTQVDRGVALLEGAVQPFPPNGAVYKVAGASYFQLALRLGSQGQAPDALRFYERAAAYRPAHARTQNNLGSTLRSLGRRDEAVEHYRRAVELNPRYAGAHLNLAGALLALGRIEDSLAHSRTAAELSPASPMGLHQLGIALSVAGRTEEALARFEEAMDLDPAWPDPVAAMARIRALHADESVRDPEKARRLAQRAVSLSGEESAIGLQTLAEVQAASGEYEAAAETARDALRIARARGDRPGAKNIEYSIDAYRKGQPPARLGTVTSGR